MKKQREKIFEYLRRKDGTPFPDETIRKWYEARAYVLHRLNETGFRADAQEHLHVNIMSDSPLMLSAVRQLALTAHFINFDEENADHTLRNRTVITIVSHNPHIREELEKEEYLSNMPKYCMLTLYDSEPENADSYLDIELRVAERADTEATACQTLTMDDADASAFLQTKSPEEVYSVDTAKAVYASRMYGLGTLIDTLPAENIHDATRYALALDFFQYQKLRAPLEPLVNAHRWLANPLKAKGGLSNVFCADCFALRANDMAKSIPDGEARDMLTLWGQYNEPLSRSEHARWNADKLIMGYRPLSTEEHLVDESLHHDRKKQKHYRDGLKNNAADPAHIDICSYAELRRIDPDSLKLDSFMVLAIPRILEMQRG